MVTSKRKFDFEGSYLKRLGESIALLLQIRPHKVRLDPRSIKNPMLRLDCAGTLPPRARCSQAVAARGAPEREVDALPPPATPRGSGQSEGVWTAPWQECGEELAEREQQMAKVYQRESLASGRRRSSP